MGTNCLELECSLCLLLQYATSVFLLNLEASLSVAKVINGGAILGFESFLAPRNAGTLGVVFSEGWVGVEKIK